MSEEIQELKETLERSLQNPSLIDREKTERFYKGIINLQQKVEQLEKELQTTANNCKQLENIRKESIEYIKNDSYFDGSSMCTNDLLNILNKGDNNE